MPSRLDDFLALPNLADVTEDVTIERLGTFKVSPMSKTQYDNYNSRCEKRDSKGRFVRLDLSKYSLMVVVNHVIDPDFSNAEFLSKVGCATAEEFIKTKFKAGEINELFERISMVSGFDYGGAELQEEVEEAKNS
jgi:hypothetical protein